MARRRRGRGDGQRMNDDEQEWAPEFNEPLMAPATHEQLAASFRARQDMGKALRAAESRATAHEQTIAELKTKLEESKIEVNELSEWVYRLETSGPHAKLADDVSTSIQALRHMAQPSNADDWLRLKCVIASLECVHEALSASAGSPDDDRSPTHHHRLLGCRRCYEDDAPERRPYVSHDPVDLSRYDDDDPHVEPSGVEPILLPAPETVFVDDDRSPQAETVAP